MSSVTECDPVDCKSSSATIGHPFYYSNGKQIAVSQWPLALENTGVTQIIVDQLAAIC